jgi:hypothetical protein
VKGLKAAYFIGRKLEPVSHLQTSILELGKDTLLLELFEQGRLSFGDQSLIKTPCKLPALFLIEPAKWGYNTGEKLPDSAIGLALAYITDGDRGSELDNLGHGCKKTFVVRRAKDLWVIPFYSLHTKNDAGKVVSFISAVLSPITSLFSLITGGPLAATVTSRITDFSNTKSAFSTMLAQLNQDTNYARSVTLGEGTTTITTTYAIITVKVRSIPSLIGDANHDFSDDLRKVGDSQSAKVADPPANSCEKLNNNLAADGLSSDEDRAFVIGYEALKNLTTKENVIDCLGRLVKIAARNPKIRANNPGLTITEDLADEAYNAKYWNPPQLSFQALRPTLHNMMQALGRYPLNGKVPKYQNAVVGLFSNGVTLVDESFREIFKKDTLPTGAPQVIDFLIEKGYYHYGCYAQTDAHSGAYTKASAVFLAIRAKSEENSASSSGVIAVLPIFADSSRRVQSLKVSDSTEWIGTLLKNRDVLYDCNGFTIK